MPRTPSTLALTALTTGLLLIASSALAAEFRSGDAVTVGADERIEDNLYASGSTLKIEGTVDGDLVVAGGTVNVTGHVTGGLLVAGGTVNVTGRVDRSIRAVGGNLTFTGEVGEDLVVGGGEVVVGESAAIGRDLVQGVGLATVSGSVGRHVHSRAGEMVLSGSVGGDVRAWVDTLRVDDGATIAGGLTYTSDATADIAPGASVAGPVEQVEPAAMPWAGPGGAVFRWLRLLVGLFALGAIFLLLAPGFTGQAVGTLRARPWGSFGMGALVALLAPLALTLVFVAGVAIGGWWLSVIGLALLFLLLALGIAIAAMTGARAVLDASGGAGWGAGWALLLGLVALTLIRYVPLLGGLAMVAAALFGAGALVRSLARLRQTPPPLEPERAPSRPLVPAEGH